MKFGFNSKVQVGSDAYDVQTEDRGASHPFIDTMVLTRGRVVYRHSTSYEDLAASGALDQAILRARVEKQHREILEALHAGALSLEKKSPAKQDGIAVKLLNAGSWLESGQVSLDIEVSSKKGGQPVTGAQVEAFIEGGENSPESYFGQTDASGRAILQFPFPTLNEQSLAALVIRAQAAESLGELRYQLKPKHPAR
jgi:hypothetical protein